jgi:hypothetical protein
MMMNFENMGARKFHRDKPVAVKIERKTEHVPGLSSLGVPGVLWNPQILSNQLTLSQPGRADYAHHISTGTPGFS